MLDHQDPAAHLVKKETMDLKVNKDPRVDLDLKDNVVNLDPKEQKDQRAPLELLDQLELTDPRVFKVRLVFKELQDPKDQTEMMDELALRVTVEHQEKLEHQEKQVKWDLLEE